MRYPPILGIIRPSFLLLTPICVLLGIAVAHASDAAVDWTAGAVAMISAVAAHVSVNALNEYEDFRSGLDLRTVRTPFSGGSGTLVAGPGLAGAARMIGLGALVLAALCALVLVWRVGWGLLPIAASGLVLVYFYTSKISRNRWLCLVAPGLGFGPLMVVGTYFSVTGTWSGSALLASLVPFFLVSNLLLLNQFPDVEADRSGGRDNLPVALGFQPSLLVYGLFAVLAFASLGLGVAAGLLPPTALIAMSTLPIAVAVYRGVNRTIQAGGPVTSALVPSLALNAVLCLLTPALFSVGMLLDASPSARRILVTSYVKIETSRFSHEAHKQAEMQCCLWVMDFVELYHRFHEVDICLHTIKATKTKNSFPRLPLVIRRARFDNFHFRLRSDAVTTFHP